MLKPNEAYNVHLCVEVDGTNFVIVATVWNVLTGMQKFELLYKHFQVSYFQRLKTFSHNLKKSSKQAIFLFTK